MLLWACSHAFIYIAGWYTTRSDGLPCARTDWMQKKM
jgi:hypothetical protein